MDATSALFLALGFFWTLPAIALVLIYLEEVYDVPFASSIGRFSHRLLQFIGRSIGSLTAPPVHECSDIRIPRTVSSKQVAGNNLHVGVETTAFAGPAAPSPDQYFEAPINRSARAEGFVSIQAVWHRDDTVVEVENWKLGVN